MSKKTNKKQLVKEVTEQLAQLNKKELFEDLIKDNKIEFELKQVNYRVRKPTQKEQIEVRKERNKKYIELLQDDSYKLKEQLIELYNQKGVNIEKMENDIKELQYKIEDVQEKLAPITDKEKIEELETQIKDLEANQSKIAIRITELLEPCVENELSEFGNSYLVYSVLEKLDKKIEKKEHVIVNDNKWIKAFATYEDFLNTDDTHLIFQATYNLSLLIYRNEIQK